MFCRRIAASAANIGPSDATPVWPAVSRAASANEATTLSATVTSLDMTRLRRMADIASHGPQARAM